jgi:hypothetical protein
MRVHVMPVRFIGGKTAICVVAGLSSYVLVRLGRSQNTVPTPRPFTAYFQETLHNFRTGEVRILYSLHAVRQDGSQLHANLKNYPTLSDAVLSLTLATEHKQVVVAYPILSISTMFLSDQQITRLKAANATSTCAPPSGRISRYRSQGLGTFLGYRVVKIEQQAHDRRVELWEALDLDCYPIRQTTEWWDPNGTITDRTEVTALSVTVGDPARDLFTIPQSFVERPPSEMNRLLTEKQVASAWIRRILPRETWAKWRIGSHLARVWYPEPYLTFGEVRLRMRRSPRNLRIACPTMGHELKIVCRWLRPPFPVPPAGHAYVAVRRHNADR